MDLVYKFIQCISTKVYDDGERRGIMDKTMMCEAALRRTGMIDLYGYCISILYCSGLTDCEVGMFQGDDLH